MSNPTKNIRELIDTQDSMGTGAKKKRVTLLSLIETRGLSREEKQRYDLDCELKGRELRARIGIKAPPSHFYVSG